MLSYLYTNPLYFVVSVGALLVSLTVHEFAHAWASNRLGDPTARLAGRMTLNPFAHLDLLGTLFLLMSGFGWGKPVPVDPFNLQNPRRDSAIISFAGPGANLILAAILGFILKIAYLAPLPGIFFLELVLPPIIILSVRLAIFNLLPFHPLDGGKVILGILPESEARKAAEILEQFGIFLLILLFLPFFGRSLLDIIINPVTNFLLKMLLPTAGGLGSPLGSPNLI